MYQQRRRAAMAGIGLGANTAEVLQLEVGPERSRAAAVMSALYARGAKLDGAVRVQGVTSQEASQLPDRIRAALSDCGMNVEEAKWGGGSDLPSLRGRVYIRWRAHSRVNAVQHINEVAAVLASAAPAFGPAARLTIQRMRVDAGPFRSDEYVYVEPAVGLPPVTCAAARQTPIPSQAPRTFPSPEPELPTRSGKQPGAGPLDPTGKPQGAPGARTALLVGATGVALLLGVGGVLYFASRKPRRRS